MLFLSSRARVFVLLVWPMSSGCGARTILDGELDGPFVDVASVDAAVAIDARDAAGPPSLDARPAGDSTARPPSGRDDEGRRCGNLPSACTGIGGDGSQVIERLARNCAGGSVCGSGIWLQVDRRGCMENVTGVGAIAQEQLECVRQNARQFSFPCVEDAVARYWLACQ